jgi:hypothetical protein
MSIKISDQQMASGQTPHSAGMTADGWTVTWLPGRTLTRNQATTAMVLAERVSHGARDQHHKDWPFIEGWAEELGLSGADAVIKISYYGGGLLAGE